MFTKYCDPVVRRYRQLLRWAERLAGSPGIPDAIR